jgi:hypothetical protein
MPDWVVLLATMLAAFTWQLRLLPALGMLVVSILGSTAVLRFRTERWLMRWITVGVPVLVGLLVLIFVWPGIVSALKHGEVSTALLLGVPPLLGPLLTGPVPRWSARLVTHWPAVAAALVGPLAVGVIFLRAPVLPDSAVEVASSGKTDVVRGQLISVDDTSTTMLQADGDVVFIPNDQVRTKTLCPEPIRPPESAVSVRGWQVEESALSWIAPTHRDSEVDPRCLGRPLNPG